MRQRMAQFNPRRARNPGGYFGTAKDLVAFINGFAKPTCAEQSRVVRGGQRIIWMAACGVRTLARAKAKKPRRIFRGF